MTQEQDLHAIASQLGRILKALKKIGDELERYNEKHRWDYPYMISAPGGYTCWKCGTHVMPNSFHSCYGSSWAGNSNIGASSVSYTGHSKFTSGQNDSTALDGI